MKGRRGSCRAEGADITRLIDAVATEPPGEGEPTIMLTQGCLFSREPLCSLTDSDCVAVSSSMLLPSTAFMSQNNIFEKFGSMHRDCSYLNAASTPEASSFGRM